MPTASTNNVECNVANQEHCAFVQKRPLKFLIINGIIPWAQNLIPENKSTNNAIDKYTEGTALHTIKKPTYTNENNKYVTIKILLADNLLTKKVPIIAVKILAKIVPAE